MSQIILVLIGLLVGFIVIAMGGGGAAIYLGILTSGFGLSAVSAAATSLFTAIPALIVGAFSQYRSGNINFKVGNRMLISALPATIVGSLTSHYIPANIYTWIVALILMLLGIQVLWQTRSSKNDETQDASSSTSKAVFFGILSGLMVGIAGLSGGGPIVAGLLLMGLDMIQAAATSAYVLVFNTLVGLLFHMSAGNINWNFGIYLMIGSVIGAAFTPFLLRKMGNPTRTNSILRPLMGIVLVFMGVKMLF